MSGFQVRHSEYGLFQGICMGLAFWHPMSDMPEQGICRIETQENAQGLIEEFEKRSPHPEHYIGKLTIEPHDAELDAKLQAEGKAKIAEYERTHP